MTDKEWFDFCFQEYRRSAERSEMVYTRFGVYTLSIVAILSANYYLVTSLVSQYREYQLAALVGIAVGVWSAFHAVESMIYAAMCLRHSGGKFEEMDTLDEFQRYADCEVESIWAFGTCDGHVNLPLRSALLEAMQKSERINRDVADRRLKYINCANCQALVSGMLVVLVAVVEVIVQSQR